jgi:hypothetical protein
VKRLRIHRRQQGDAPVSGTPVPAAANQPLPSMREGEARAARDASDAARQNEADPAPIDQDATRPSSQRDSAA